MTTVIGAAGLCALAPAGAGAYYSHPGKLLAPLTSCPGQGDATATVAVQQKAMLCLHRHARRRYHKLTGATENFLSRNRKLHRSAAKKRNDIVQCANSPKQELSHTACGHRQFYWFKKVGYFGPGPPYSCHGAAENLGAGSQQGAAPSSGTARAVMKAWLSSSQGHQANILRGRYYDIGIGLWQGTFRTQPNSQVWVVHFGDHC